MRDTKTHPILAAVFAALAGLIATGGVGVAAAPAGIDTTVPEAGDPRLPEGVYRTPELTADQVRAAALAAGFAEDDVNAFVPDEGTAVWGLRLANGGWTQYESIDGVPEEAGWRGTYEIVDDDTVVATDPGAVITYDYSFDGEQLTLDVVEIQCTEECPAEEWIIQTIIFESAPFTLQEPAGGEDAVAAPATYASTSFVMPFEVTLPEWAAPEPSGELPNFVTWEGTEVDRGIRFLVPVSVYPPGETSPTEVPEDYLAYLLAQSEQGAVFEDVVETAVDGRPATILTATTSTGLDGSLGCQEDDLLAADCFGVQPDLVLRMAVIDTDDGPPLLIWVRDISGVDAEYETFEAMLASLRFRAEAAPTSEAPAESVVPASIDGVWTMTLSRD